MSNAVISQFVPSTGVWIVGEVTSLTFNGMVTGFVVPSLKVTVALIFWFPYADVSIGEAITFEILSVPLTFPTFDVAVTLAFRSSFVTGMFWFTSICAPETSYSSLSLRTFTVAVTSSTESSG